MHRVNYDDDGAHRAAFVAALAPAPLARGPQQVGLCAVLYVLHTVLTCCTQPVTDCIGVASLSMAAFRCSL